MLDKLDFNVEFDPGKYAEVMRRVELLANKAEIEKAIASAARKAVTEARKETIKLIAGGYTLGESEIRKTITTRRISSTSMGAAMDIRSSSFPLTLFSGVLPQSVMPPAKGPVTVKVKTSGTVAEFKRAFIAKMKSGHVGVYEREESKRRDKIRIKGKDPNKETWHIQQYFGPSVPGMFGRDKDTAINKAVMEKATVIFDKWVATNLDRLMYG